MIAHVLVVDDEPDIRRIAELALQHVAGWRVDTAPSGATAIAWLAENRPDVVLLDVMMPELDGPATLAALRERGDRIPVIFMTAKAQRRDRDQYTALGASGVIPKPFDPMLLAEEIRAILAEAT